MKGKGFRLVLYPSIKKILTILSENVLMGYLFDNTGVIMQH